MDIFCLERLIVFNFFALRNSLTLGIVSKLSLRSLTRSFPFCLKPFGFSRPGYFYDTSYTEGKGRNASVANEKIRNTRFGTNRGRLPDFFMQPSRRRSLAVGIPLRNFVSEKSTADETAGGNKEKRSPRITRKDRSHHSYMNLPYVI